MDMTFADVIAAIDTLDMEQCDVVFTACRARQKYLRSAASRQALATFKIGVRP